MLKSSSQDASSVGSFISPSAASQQRFHAQGSTVLAALEKTSNQVHVDFDEFYAERVGNFEYERSIFAHYFRLIEPKRDDTYNLEWENRKLVEETRISKLEFQQLEDKINQIRVDVETMKRESMEEQNSQVVRKQQIHRLEELARPVERDITYIVPDRFTQFRDRESRKQGRVRNADGSYSEKSTTTSSSSSNRKGNAIANTTAAILDPTKSVKTGEVLQLESRLHDETIRVTSMLQDVHTQIRHAIENRHATTVQYAESHQEDVKRARQLWQENDTVDFQCFYAVAELLKLRFRIMIAQREEIEALETLQRDRDDFKEREEQLKSEILEEMERSRRSVQHELEDSMREFQHQLVSLNEQIENLERKKYELEAANSKTSQREEQLLAELAMWESRYEKLRRRNALDMEGYRREIDMLEKKLLHMEKTERKRLRQIQLQEQQHRQQRQQQRSLLELDDTFDGEYDPPSVPHTRDQDWHDVAQQLAALHFQNEHPVASTHHSLTASSPLLAQSAAKAAAKDLVSIRKVKAPRSPGATSGGPLSPTPPSSATKAKKSQSPSAYL